MSRVRNAASAFVLCMLVASTASAQLSEKYKEWREGPVQWIMTSEEMRAWKNVKTDQQAIDFIDLFWARRDPTPGTAVNEYHIDFDVYVNSADQQFAEKGRRGAMTDRGRVAIVLGPPTTGGAESGYTSGAGNATGAITGTSGSGRQLAARYEWHYDFNAAQKFGMPRATVVFLQDPVSGRIKRDIQRTDFIPASANAIKAAIKNPDLKEVPEWAMRGGLEQNPPQTASAPAPAPAPAAQAQPGSVIATTTVPFPEPGVTYEPKGVSRLTLSRNVYDIDTETTTDPFANLTSVTTFKPSEELGWASQVCTGSNAEPNVKFSLRLTGTAAGEVINRVSEAEELVPDRIRALNGCYMLRGAVPLEGMNPGNYELEVAVYDPETRKDIILTKPFTIQ